MSDFIDSVKYTLIYSRRIKLKEEGYSEEEINNLMEKEIKAFEGVYDIPFPELLEELRKFPIK